MSLADWLKSIIGQWWDSYWREAGKAWDVLLAELNRIWDFHWWEFLIPLVSGGLVGKRLLDTIGAFQEFAEDLRLIPARIGVEVVDDLIPVPDSWKNRVMTADQALRFLVHEALDFAVNIVDLDLPSEIDVAKGIELSGAVKEGFDEARSVDAEDLPTRVRRIMRGPRFNVAARTLSKAWIVSVIGAVVTTFMAAGCVGFAGWAVWKAHQTESSARFLQERALSQNSRRIYGIHRGQRRENLKRGSD